MKCPKCHYISFGSGNRCRNCGYDFSLSDEGSASDLPIQSDNPPLGPLADLPLGARRAGVKPAHETAPADPGGANGGQAPATSADLPLFTTDAGRDDAPLVQAPAVPRPPLAVRRGPPPAPKPRQRPADREAEPRLDLDEPRFSRPPRREADPLDHTTSSTSADASGAESAPTLARLAAAVIDLTILAVIDFSVVYLTLRLAHLQLADAMVLPKIPLVAFLLLLNGGYFVLFTAAGGQTIGKMATGIRVVPQASGESGARIGFSTAVVRAAAYAASLLPAGLGFVPILFSHDGRTLHDRLSDTRVVKA